MSQPAAGPARGAGRRAPIITERAAFDFDANGAGWQVVDGWLAAVRAARAPGAGPVGLHFHRPQGFGSLARAVAAIRARPGPAPAVMVRETGARLRLVQQAALLRLGASLLLTRQTDARRLRLAVESFVADGDPAREAAPDIERVLAPIESSAADPARSPARFREEVEQLLAATGDEPQHVLLRLQPADGRAPEQLAAIGGRRARDALVCADGAAVWVFLLGCAPGEADAVLARLYGARHVRLFAGRSASTGVEPIRAALAALRPTSSPGAATSSAAR